MPILLFCCETWSLTLRMEQRLRSFENRKLRNIFGPERDEVNRERRRLYNEECDDLYSSPNIIWVTKSTRMISVGHDSTYRRQERCKHICWKSLGNRDHLQDLGLYRRITLEWIFRLIQIIHMTPEQQSGKN